MKSVLVLGLGVSGRAAVSFLNSQGIKVSAADSNLSKLLNNPEILSLQKLGTHLLNEDDIQDLKAFDCLIVSPGVSPTNRLYALAKRSNISILGEVELAFRHLKNRIIAITGTNGKTTVTLLVAHVLNSSGKRAKALGNVGVALTSPEVMKSITPDEIIVAELSSFQLDTMCSRVIDAGVILNITPDHLDRYGSMHEYAASKMQMAKYLKKEGVLFIEKKCEEVFTDLLKGFSAKSYGFSSACDLYSNLSSLILNGKTEIDLPAFLKGKASHDLENLMAAYALCRHFDVTPQQFMNAFSTFKKPSHRIQHIGNFNGVNFYDDSKGTNLDAVIRAVESLPGPIWLIAGGVDKGAPYTPWIQSFQQKVKGIFAIGQAAKKIEADLSHAIPVYLCSSLENAVISSVKKTKKGDTVLLSPGCASFDMFRDYAHRGDEFQRIVIQLKTNGEITYEP